MKTPILRPAVFLLLTCILIFSLTGCAQLDYRKAVSLYNAKKYDAAAELFYELGSYADSADLLTNSRYWAAVSLAEAGRYSEALPRFLKLGTYENSAQWAAECKYQLALSAFSQNNYTDAEAYLQDLSGYKQAEEYLRQIEWQRFFDAITAVGTESDGGVCLQAERDGKVFQLTADTAHSQLLLSVSSSRGTAYRYSDSLMLCLTRSSTTGTFTADSTFSMDYNGMQIGSRQEASGKLDITTCTGETVLVPALFEKTVTDIQGKTTVSLNPSHIRMTDTMAENLRDLLTVLPELVSQAGISPTLQDIGFDAL